MYKTVSKSYMNKLVMESFVKRIVCWAPFVAAMQSAPSFLG